MPRPRRIDAPGYPQHVVQRGNNRQRVFFADGDRVAYLRLLCNHAGQQQGRVHAYVLMDNHIHLLATPDVSGGLSRMMQAVNRAHVRRVNDRQGRTGTLWAPVAAHILNNAIALAVLQVYGSASV